MQQPTHCKYWSSYLSRAECNGMKKSFWLKHSKLNSPRYQQLEGTLNELCEHNLPTGETKEQLLNERGNSVSFWQADYSNLRPQLDGYQVIVADFRHKDAAQHLFHLSTKLQAGGLLLLGSIDDVSGAESAGPLSSLVVLDRLFTRVHCDGALESYPHIYKETRNKHQYAISHFSAWRKKEDAEGIQLTAEEEVIFKYYLQLSFSFQERLIHYSTTTAQYYEDKSILTSYDRFHFGPGLLGVKNFPQRMAEVIFWVGLNDEKDSDDEKSTSRCACQPADDLVSPLMLPWTLDAVLAALLSSFAMTSSSWRLTTTRRVLST